MARTTKSVSFKKIKNKSETNAHFRRNVPMKDRKKDQSKYGSRASRAPEHNQYSQDLELELDDIADLETEADNLRKQFIRLRQEDIDNVKHLLEIMGVKYYNLQKKLNCAVVIHKI